MPQNAKCGHSFFIRKLIENSKCDKNVNIQWKCQYLKYDMIRTLESLRLKLQIIIYFPTLGQAKDEVDGWLEKGSLASGWPSSSVRRTNATVHTRHHMAVKVNNFSKNSNILYLDWWEVRGCSKCCLPAWWPNAHPPLFLMSRSSHSRERNFLQFSQERSNL